MTVLENFTLSHRLVEILGPRIVSGDFGDTTIQGLCGEYHVSRTVVREALERLADKGLVSTQINVGTRATAEADWDLLDADVLRWLAPHDPGLAQEAQQVAFALAGIPGRVADAVAGRLKTVFKAVGEPA